MRAAVWHRRRERAGGAARTVRGVVMAADGSNPKYADAVYVVTRNVRHVHRSTLPIEVRDCDLIDGDYSGCNVRHVHRSTLPIEVRD